jgi:hypothetical protein
LRDRYDAIWKSAFKELQKSGIYQKKGPVDLLLFFGSLNFCFNWFHSDGNLSMTTLPTRPCRFCWIYQRRRDDDLPSADDDDTRHHLSSRNFFTL